MGLFTNHKKLCPICGNPTPRLLPTKIEDQPICKECDNKVDLPIGAVNSMSLSDFRQYLAAYEENYALRSVFQSTYRSCGLIFDEEKGLIRLKNNDSSWVIEKQYLKSFCIFEDDKPLFESGNGTLNCYQSDIPDRVNELVPIITQFYLQKREYERQEERERELCRGKETDEERRERERISDRYRPRFEDPQLFQGFRIEVTFDHPYWKTHEYTIGAPTFSDNYPDADGYKKRYGEQVQELHDLAVKLMYMIDPAAKETRIGLASALTAGSTAQAAPVDVVDEIKKYKELLDQGLITQEEFTAKKRQLLGI